MTTRFSRTEKAASKDKRSRWDLIEAIAADAVENGLKITSSSSADAAAAALASAGEELAIGTVKNLCNVAKFDHESTAMQRRVWRRYGASTVLELAKAGWSQEGAAEFLSGTHKTVAEIREAIDDARDDVVSESGINDRWGQWVNRMNNLMMDGARLLQETEATKIELTGQAHLALTIYQRLTERQLDAEIRELFESVDSK